jgi:hypothetical protein
MDCFPYLKKINPRELIRHMESGPVNPGSQGLMVNGHVRMLSRAVHSEVSRRGVRHIKVVSLRVAQQLTRKLRDSVWAERGSRMSLQRRVRRGVSVLRGTRR